jgi:hypothetical protein
MRTVTGNPSHSSSTHGLVWKRTAKTLLAITLSIAIVLGAVSPAEAESLLSIRQSILVEQRDRILIGFQARIGPIGRVHSIEDDCDVHVPLRTTALFLAILGEIKNACSMGPTRAELVALGVGPMQVEGAFRIWFEGHDAGVPFREEEGQEPEEYENSGPPHLVELHPITRLGPIDFLNRVKFIEKNGQTFAWKTADSFERAVRARLTIRRRTIGGRRYVVLRCTCPRLANHYQLDVEIADSPHPTDNGDGIVASGPIFDESGGVLLPVARFFAIQGTPAAQVLQMVTAGDRLTVYALARLSLRPLLERVRSSVRIIDMPIELLVLHAIPQ